MAKFNTGSATIDKFLQIKKADEEFYKYVGQETFYSLIQSVYPADVEKLSAAVEGLKNDGSSMVTFRMKREDEKFRWVLAALEYETIELNGEPLINVNIQDIQALERDINAIKNQNAEFGEYFGMMDELLFSYNIDQDEFKIFMGGGKQMLNLVQCTFKTWIDEVKNEKYIDVDYQDVFEQMCRDISSGARIFKHEFLSNEFSVDKKMELLQVKGRTVNSHDRERKVLGCISVISQDTKKKELSLNVEYNKDAALDILNKKAITNYAKRAIAANPKGSIYIGIVDLDNFKNINDTFGHMFGDEVLVTVADILKDAVAGKGVVGRIGGDELMIVLEKVESHSELRGILRAIRSNVEWAYKDKEGVNLTCSAGVAAFPAHARDYDKLFMIADKMLYKAKKKGKNRYVIYTPEIHGDVMKDEVENNFNSTVAYKVNKEGTVISLIDLFLQKKVMTYENVLSIVGHNFKLDEINIFQSDDDRVIINWEIKEDKKAKSIAYVRENDFEGLFDENGIAVVNSVTNIDGRYGRAYDYMEEHDITAAIIYKMQNDRKEGYVAFYKKTDAARMWEAADVAYLNFIGKILELSLEDR
jgi:diguanylate cyclase (GGDEF)-like protein